MGKYTGTALYIVFKGQTLHGEHRSFSFENTGDVDDVTAGADVDKEYIVTHKDATMQLTLVDTGTDLASERQVLYTHAQGTLTFGPQGTASGMPKYECQAIVTGHSTEYPYDGHTEIQASFQRNGAWAENYEEEGDTW